MKLALKFVLVLIVVLFVTRSFEGFLTVQRETDRLNADIQRDAQLLKKILSTSVQSTWLANDRDQALDLVEAFDLDEHPIGISWRPFKGNNGLEERLDKDSLAALKSGDSVALRQRRSRRGEVQYFFIPVDVPGADGAIQLAETLKERSRYLENALTREVIAGSFVFVASGGTMLLLGFAIIGRPLSRLQERIRRIGEGDLGQQVVLRGRDELSTLAKCLNEMCTKLAASRERETMETEKRIAAMEQVRHMDRLTTIGRLASGVAHELGTPLNVISGRAGMIRDGTIDPESGQIQENAKTIKSQADRMTGIIRHLLDLARQRPPKRLETNGADVVRQAVELVNCLGYKAKVRLEPTGESSSLVADVDPVQVQQVITNLIENALQAVREGGEVVVVIKSVLAHPPAGVDAQQGRFLQIAVRDNGAGIAEEDLGKVFDPFFTTKDVGQGTGLGLSITYGIVREHGGWIDVVSEVGKGSCFTVYIPQEK